MFPLMLFPHLQDFRLMQISCDGVSIRLECERTPTTASCPLCERTTGPVEGHINRLKLRHRDKAMDEQGERISLGDCLLLKRVGCS